MREDRQFQRRPGRHVIKTSCQVVRESDFRLVADQMENLSTWGMLVSPADPVKTGEVVYVSFQLPGSQDWFDAMAVVTRVIHGRRPTEVSRKLGLEFLDLKPYDQYRLKKAIHAAPPTPPGVRLGRRAKNFALAALVV